LNLETILVKKTDEGILIKLSDFSCATFINTEDEYMTTICGSLHYVAPEVLS